MLLRDKTRGATVLRFRPDSQSTPQGSRGVSRRERLRLWLLVFALGLVLLALRRIGHPEAQQNLHRWLGLETASPGEAVVPPSSPQQHMMREMAGEILATPSEEVSRAVTSPPDHSLGNLSAQSSASREHNLQRDLKNNTTQLDEQLREIQDNTSFRPQEQAAWFTLLARLGQSTPSTLQQQSMGTLSYAQLLGQPDVYRGQVVTLHGTTLREERLQAPANSAGIHAYHRLILQPVGGGEWPFVVYSLKLPANFPRGDSLRARIEVTGYFFKNWSYSWGNGLGLAPVILANNVHWIQREIRGNTHASSDRLLTTNWKLLVLAMAAAALFAWMVLVMVWRQTGRLRQGGARHHAGRAEQQIHDTLRQLSERESRQ